MRIVFIGYAVGSETVERLIGASVAGNKMQLSVLKELSKRDDVDLRIITVYPTAAYPQGKLFYTKERTMLFEKQDTIRVGFFNLPIIKQFMQAVGVYRNARTLVDKNTTIFTFNSYPPVGLPAVWLKKRFGCKIGSIMADLPIDDNKTGRNWLSKLLIESFDSITKKTIKLYDYHVTLNKNAVDKYANGKPYIVVEGGISSEDISELAHNSLNQRYVVYGGALTEYSGVMNLLEAMKLIEDTDVILKVYGTGYLEKRVKQYASELPNVLYCGKISNEQMMEEERNAYLLVNPRIINDPIAMVTFPSKIFEYMLSGTPVLSTKLNGLTEEFIDNMYIVENDTSLALSKMLNQIMKLPKEVVQKKGHDARNFVIKEKKWEKQCDRIINFIDEVMKQ